MKEEDAPAITAGTPITHFYYDTWGDETSMTDPNGKLTTFGYNDLGEQDLVVDPPTTDDLMGVQTSLETLTKFNALGQAIDTQEKNSADGTVLQHATSIFDTAGLLKQTENDLTGDTETLQYDGDGNVLFSTDTGIGTTAFLFNALGEESSETDPGQDPINFTYNTLGEILTQIQGSDTITNGYDHDGNQTSFEDPNQKTTTDTYYPDGQIHTSTDILGDATTYTYDDDGNVLSVMDGNGYTTRYAYDADDNLTGVTDPLGNATTYGYDADGNKTSVTDTARQRHALHVRRRRQPDERHRRAQQDDA